MISLLTRFIPAFWKQKIAYQLRLLKYFLLALALTPFELISKKYATIHARPKYAKDVRIVSPAGQRDYWEHGIVVQGPLLLKERFTVETLLLYKKLFPGAAVILSTWDDEHAATLESIEGAGIIIVRTKPIEDGGPINANRQITSSRNGIAKARALKKTYVLKTRTDQRCYAPEMLPLFSNMLMQFPKIGCTSRGRIIAMSANNARKKLYHVPDHVLFGYTEDIERYFSADLVPKSHRLTFPEADSPFVTEGYLCTEYAKKIGYPLTYTFDDYYRLIAQQFAFVDVSAIDWYWGKRGHRYQRFFERREFEYGYSKDMKIDFAAWLEIYRSHIEH